MRKAILQILPKHQDFAANRPPLTGRQQQALWLVSEGLCNKEIAVAMGISLAGARKHVEALRRVYSASNNAQLIRRAFESGELRPSDRDKA